MSVTRTTDSTAVPSSDTNLPVTVVQAAKGWVPLDLREVWEYRELLVIMTKRDLTTRYKQTILGVAWAVVQPLLTMTIFSIIFGRIAKLSTDGLPYMPFVLPALIAWTYFSTAMGKGSNSLVGSSFLLKKVYFPRIIIPLTSTIAPLADFVIAFITLTPVLLYFGQIPHLQVVFLPLFLLLAYVFALGIALWLSALNVQFRDVQHVIPFLTMILMYASPIAYPSNVWHSEKYPYLESIVLINPLAQVAEGFRWCLLTFDPVKAAAAGLPVRTYAPDWHTAVSILVALAVLVSGAYVFRRMERTFADVV